MSLTKPFLSFVELDSLADVLISQKSSTSDFPAGFLHESDTEGSLSNFLIDHNGPKDIHEKCGFSRGTSDVGGEGVGKKISRETSEKLISLRRSALHTIHGVTWVVDAFKNNQKLLGAAAPEFLS